MKTFALVAALFATSTYAQVSSLWKLNEVSKDKVVVGHIYHTYAIGTQGNTEKVVSSLRLICSTFPGTEPVIALLWNGLTGSSEQELSIIVDGKEYPKEKWVQEGPLLFKNVSQSKTIDLIKGGRTIAFTWFDASSTKRTVAFDVIDFDTQLPNFNTSCHIRL